MNRAEVIARLQTVFDEVFIEPVPVKPELTAKDVEEWDSLLHVSLIVAVEKAFRVRFRVGEMETAQNVGDMVDLIVKRLSER